MASRVALGIVVKVMFWFASYSQLFTSVSMKVVDIHHYSPPLCHHVITEIGCYLQRLSNPDLQPGHHSTAVIKMTSMTITMVAASKLPVIMVVRTMR